MLVNVLDRQMEVPTFRFRLMKGERIVDYRVTEWIFYGHRFYFAFRVDEVPVVSLDGLSPEEFIQKYKGVPL